MKPYQKKLCDECKLMKDSLFSNLTEEQFNKLQFEKHCQNYKPNEYIFHEGNHAIGFYCVGSGIIKLFKTGISGKEQIITFAKKGDIIGYRSVLSKEPFCTSAQVLIDANVCFIQSSILFELVKINQEFNMQLIKQACRELGEANKYIIDIAQKTVRERVAEILVFLHNEFDEDENGFLKVPLARKDIAGMVGTATESLIRILSEYKSDNIIELEGRKIKLLNKKKLEQIANQF